MPVPVVVCGVDLLAGAGGHVVLEGDLVAAQRVVPRLNFHLPAIGLVAAGADGSCTRGFAFEEKGGSVCELGDGGVDAPVPDSCRDKVAAGLQVWSDVKALVAPMDQVAAGGTIADALTIHVEDEAVVRTDADDIGCGDGVEFQLAPEVKDQRLAQRRGRVSDPASVPLAGGWIDCRRGLRLKVWDCERNESKWE